MNKILFTTFIFLILIRPGFSQDSFSTGYKWNNLIYKNPSFTIDNESLQIGSDTIIDDLNYKRLLRFVNGQSDNITSYGFLRETYDKKIYFRPDSAIMDYLIYDFSVNIDDTITVFGITGYNKQTYLSRFDLYVKKIDSITIGSEIHRQIHLLPLSHEDFISDIWIENIGNLEGFLHCDAGLVGGNGYKLICFSTNNILYYQDPNFTNCEYTYSINNIQTNDQINDQIKIYPNPILEIATITVGNYNFNNIYALEVYDGLGRKVLRSEINSPYFFNRNGLKTGLYIFRFFCNDEPFKTEKIMIE